MSNKFKVALVVLIVVGAGAWYAFRPERLFINQRVNEQFPTAAAASNQLASGQFQNPRKIAELLKAPPDPLESQFRATYTSLLNLLGLVKTSKAL